MLVYQPAGQQRRPTRDTEGKAKEQAGTSHRLHQLLRKDHDRRNAAATIRPMATINGVVQNRLRKQQQRKGQRAQNRNTDNLLASDAIAERAANDSTDGDGARNTNKCSCAVRTLNPNARSDRR